MLSAKQNKAIALLATGMSQREVALEISVARETVNRWCGEFEFSDALHTVTQETLRHATGVLRCSVLRAAHVLSELMSDQKPDAIRLRAAIALLQLTQQHDNLKLPEASRPIADHYDSNGKRYLTPDEHEAAFQRRRHLAKQLLDQIEAARVQKPSTRRRGSHRNSKRNGANIRMA